MAMVTLKDLIKSKKLNTKSKYKIKLGTYLLYGLAQDKNILKNHSFWGPFFKKYKLNKNYSLSEFLLNDDINGCEWSDTKNYLSYHSGGIFWNEKTEDYDSEEFIRLYKVGK